MSSKPLKTTSTKEFRNNLGQFMKDHPSFNALGLGYFPKGVLSTPKPFPKGHIPWNIGTKGKNVDWEKRKRRQAAYVRTNRYRIWQRNYYKVKRLEMLDLVGKHECGKCGFEDIRALQIDHINSDGAKERKAGNSLLPNSSKSINYIKKNKNKLQILCANCNMIKRDEKKECRKFNY